MVVFRTGYEYNEAPQPPTPVSNTELAERAAAPVPPPVIEATYDVLQQPLTDSDHSVNTEPGNGRIVVDIVTLQLWAFY